MNVVVIGGHSRNIGKTSVMAALIRNLTPPGWAAVKITQYGHGVCSVDGKSCACDPGEHGFVLTEELRRNGRGDTERFLDAGARRSFWLRVRHGQLVRAFPALQRVLRQEKWVMIESNSVLGMLHPALYLFVLDPSQRDFKASARRYLSRADALVTTGSACNADPWPDVDPRLFSGRPGFTVSSPEYSNHQLNHFVRQKLGLADRPPTEGEEGGCSGRGAVDPGRVIG